MASVSMRAGSSGDRGRRQRRWIAAAQAAEAARPRRVRNGRAATGRVIERRRIQTRRRPHRGRRDVERGCIDGDRRRRSYGGCGGAV